VRIVSLCPSITETLIDFGLAGSLVGITRYCIRPREVTRTLPKVGGTKNPDIDAIRSAHPDLVFVNEEENTKAVYDALSKDLTVDASFPRHVFEVPALLRRFGRLTGCEEAAEDRARALERGLAELSSRRRSASWPSFRFAYLIWRDPWMSVNQDTYVSDLFALAGGLNVFSDARDRYPTIELADLAAHAPDLVLLPDEPFHFREKDRAEVAALLPRAKIDLISGDDCCWHGVRSIEGVALAAKIGEGMAMPR
jgi:ABC-type Fe3+-hydroxamate transport system substrate-binding protein